jgi:glucosamine--fructose-6-phosphate aminotransferase (isomerizing)
MPDSILHQEIHQQPEIIQTLLDEETQHVQEIVNRLHGHFHYVIIAARGTSDNAARYAQYLFGAHNHLAVSLTTPSLFTLYQTPPDMRGALVIGVSQSGKSPDIVSVLTEAKKQGCPTLAIVNQVDSPLANAADFVIPIHAQTEKAIAATKTYTASLAALALFSVLLDGNQEHLKQLASMPAWVQSTLDGIDPRLSQVERYRYMDKCTVIGRGYNYCSAFETSLKLKELSGVLADPYSSADFRHGPIALIHKGVPVILIAPSGAVSADLYDMLHELDELNSEMIMVSDEQRFLEKAHLALPIPQNIPEWLSPIVAIVPGQLFAMRLTIERGMDPDNPKGLHKVTETY